MAILCQNGQDRPLCGRKWLDPEGPLPRAGGVRRRTGPFDRPTADPILVVNPVYDTATSYQAARSMTSRPADARLLTLQGYGRPPRPPADRTPRPSPRPGTA
ncbi:alpha/beta hydrolase [Streptomyces sp. NPDC054958]